MSLLGGAQFLEDLSKMTPIIIGYPDEKLSYKEEDIGGSFGCDFPSFEYVRQGKEDLLWQFKTKLDYDYLGLYRVYCPFERIDLKEELRADNTYGVSVRMNCFLERINK